MPPAAIALFGPTGVGKTAVAVELAALLRARGENPLAISADALQVYEGLEILTGAATEAERSRLEHRLIGFVPVTETCSVGEYAPRAHAEIDAARAAGRRPLVLGGTGLYLRAALAELDLAPPPPAELRERLSHEATARGAPALWAELREKAPDTAAAVHPADRSRIIRKLELLELGEELQRPGDRAQLWTEETRVPTLLFGLVRDRAELDASIDRRVDAMVAAGVIDEVRRADAAGASSTARKALGFRELLTGDVEAVKRRTRKYARRQLTWLRKLPDVEIVDLAGREPSDAAREIDDRLLSREAAGAAGPSPAR